MEAKSNFMIYTGLLVLAVLTMGETAKNDALKAVTAASDKFAMDLYMSLKKNDANMIMSPLGVQIVLAMVASGAKGTTLDELVNVMHYPNDLQTLRAGYHALIDTLKAPELKMANSIFVENKLELATEFSSAMSNYFTSAIERLPFESNPGSAANTINSWADKNTNGKIKDLFQAGDLKDALVVLANAIHFKAKWKYQFDEKNTQDREFHTSKSTHVMVKMMSIKGSFRYGYIPELKSKILELPYENDQFRMVIILPDDIEGLPEAERKLHSMGISTAMEYLHRETVEVKIPRFKIESDMELLDALKKLGLKKLFGEGCDLSGMAGNPGDIMVSKVKQKAFIEVNEEGTEAAAVTAVRIQKRSLELKQQFHVDRPFGYLVSDDQGHSLLAGRCIHLGDRSATKTLRVEL